MHISKPVQFLLWVGIVVLLAGISWMLIQWHYGSVKPDISSPPRMVIPTNSPHVNGPTTSPPGSQ